MIGRGSCLPCIHSRHVAGIRPGQAMHRPTPRMINLAYRLRNGPGVGGRPTNRPACAASAVCCCSADTTTARNGRAATSGHRRRLACGTNGDDSACGPGTGPPSSPARTSGRPSPKGLDKAELAGHPVDLAGLRAESSAAARGPAGPLGAHRRAGSTAGRTGSQRRGHRADPAVRAGAPRAPVVDRQWIAGQWSRRVEAQAVTMVRRCLRRIGPMDG